MSNSPLAIFPNHYGANTKAKANGEQGFPIAISRKLHKDLLRAQARRAQGRWDGSPRSAASQRPQVNVPENANAVALRLSAELEAARELIVQWTGFKKKKPEGVVEALKAARAILKAHGE